MNYAISENRILFYKLYKKMGLNNTRIPEIIMKGTITTAFFLSVFAWIKHDNKQKLQETLNRNKAEELEKNEAEEREKALDEREKALKQRQENTKPLGDVANFSDSITEKCLYNMTDKERSIFLETYTPPAPEDANLETVKYLKKQLEYARKITND